MNGNQLTTEDINTYFPVQLWTACGLATPSGPRAPPPAGWERGGGRGRFSSLLSMAGRSVPGPRRRRSPAPSLLVPPPPAPPPGEPGVSAAPPAGRE